MRTLIVLTMLLAATTASAQQIHLPDLEHLAAIAKETTNVTLDASLLKLASGFLSEQGDEATVKKLAQNLKGVYVRSFEFDYDGAYADADLQPIRDQLKGPGWNRIVTVHDRDGGEDVGIWLYREGQQVGGLVVLATEPREVTIVNLVGTVSLQDLAMLGGKLGVPTVKAR
jgi:hypothetical protein